MSTKHLKRSHADSRYPLISSTLPQIDCPSSTPPQIHCPLNRTSNTRREAEGSDVTGRGVTAGRLMSSADRLTEM